MPDRARAASAVRWGFLQAAALAALLGLAACGGGNGGSDGPTQPTPQPNQPIFYTAVGASDAVGYGGSVVCLPLVDCPNGTGYVWVLARQLAATRTVTTTNLGIPGAVIGPEIESLADSLGRGVANFVEDEARFVAANTTMVTIFAGGNDANVVGDVALRRGLRGADLRAFLDQQIEQFRTSYDALLRAVRDRAPAARVYVLNVPNLAALPYVASRPLEERQGLQYLAVNFSTRAANRLTSQGAVVVDILCDARTYDPANVSRDGFHPSDQGYALMADLLHAAVTAGSAPAPAASCPQMTTVPPL